MAYHGYCSIPNVRDVPANAQFCIRSSNDAGFWQMDAPLDFPHDVFLLQPLKSLVESNVVDSIVIAFGQHELAIQPQTLLR